MLGLSPISSRSISGGATSLIAVPMTLAASGVLVTLGGSALGGNYLDLTASGAFVSLSGTAVPLVGYLNAMEAQGPILTVGGLAVPTWTQQIAASGNVVHFTGRPRLFVAGKPIVVRMISEPFRVREATEHYGVKMIHARYQVRRPR